MSDDRDYSKNVMEGKWKKIHYFLSHLHMVLGSGLRTEDIKLSPHEVHASKTYTGWYDSTQLGHLFWSF